MKRFSIVVLLCVLYFTVYTSGATKAATASLKAPRIALTSPTTVTSVHRLYGPIHEGKAFGLEMTNDNFTIFDDHATATQAVIAGQADIVGGSFVSTLLVQQAGQDFKVFCPNVGPLDYVLVGRNGVTKIEQLLDPKVRVGVDTPGGSGDAVMNSLFQANDVKATSQTLPNITELGSSGLRLSAWASNKIDVTVLQLNQYRQAEKDVPDAVIIAELFKVAPYYVHTAFSAPTKWLDENQDVAAALCASVLKGAKVLSSDFDQYYSAVKEFMSKPPEKDSLKEVFSMISEYDFWQLKTGIQPKSVEFMAKVAVNSGQLEKVPTFEQVVDERPYKKALELLGDDFNSTPETK